MNPVHVSFHESSDPEFPYLGAFIARRGQSRVVGRLELWRPGRGNWPDRGIVVAMVNVTHTQRRRGVATRLYEEAAQYAWDVHHAPLVSDLGHSDAARGFWAKQLRLGRARRVTQPRYGRPVERFVLATPPPQSLA